MSLGWLLLHVGPCDVLRDDGLRVECATVTSDEWAVFFALDSTAVRRRYPHPTIAPGAAGDILCDGLLVYRPSQGKPFLAFVELKGSDVEHGMAQVESAIERVLPALQEPPSVARETLRIRAFVVTDRHAVPFPARRFRNVLVEVIPVPTRHSKRRATYNLRPHLGD